MTVDTLLRKNIPFHQYLELWDQFLIAHNSINWADVEDEEPTKPKPYFKVICRKTHRKKSSTQPQKATGVIKKWFSNKNFGFIQCKKYPNQDIFCHRSSITGAPIVGMTLTFKLEKKTGNKYVAHDAVYV